MTTFKKTHKRKLSSLVKQQVPEYVLSDHPKFLEFLKAYYLFMESAELQLDTITAIDQILLETETATVSHLLFDQTNIEEHAATQLAQHPNQTNQIHLKLLQI